MSPPPAPDPEPPEPPPPPPPPAPPVLVVDGLVTVAPPPTTRVGPTVKVSPPTTTVCVFVAGLSAIVEVPITTSVGLTMTVTGLGAGLVPVASPGPLLLVRIVLNTGGLTGSTVPAVGLAVPVFSFVTP